MIYFERMHAKSLQSCLTLCNPMHCSPPGSSVHGILQAIVLKWVVVYSSRGSSWPRDQTHICCLFLYWQEDALPLVPLESLWYTLLLWSFSCSVTSHSFRPHGLQHARLPCPSPCPRACSISCSLSQWCHPTISFSVVPSCLLYFPASGSFLMSWLFESGG